MITSLPGKAKRMLVEPQGLPRSSTCILGAEPGKFDIKRREPDILFISLHIASFFKLAIMSGRNCRFSQGCGNSKISTCLGTSKKPKCTCP